MFKRKKDENAEYLNKAYKVRIYPDIKQINQIDKTLGCSRFVYNYFLNEKILLYKMTRTNMGVTDCNNECSGMKKMPQYAFLKEADKFALTNSLLDLNSAYENFFRERAKGNVKQGFPKFKSRKNPKDSYTTNMTNNNIAVDTKNRTIKLPKLGSVKYKFSNTLDNLFGVIKSATISRTSTGKYYVSLLTEKAVSMDKVQSPKLTKDKVDVIVSTGRAVGIDLGLKHLAILSSIGKIENPKYYTKAVAKLRRLSKTLTRKEYGSKNYNEAKLKLVKFHEYVADLRKDFLHKVSRFIVNENQIICMEDLNVKGLVKNHKLARSISDAGWSMLKNFISYKAKMENKIVVFINRFYPSSKECSCCRSIKPMLTLSEREWLCPVCKTIHDRDNNASNNILNEGLRMLTV